jgi:hypothetical protein
MTDAMSAEMRISVPAVALSTTGHPVGLHLIDIGVCTVLNAFHRLLTWSLLYLTAIGCQLTAGRFVVLT